MTQTKLRTDSNNLIKLLSPEGEIVISRTKRRLKKEKL